MERERQPKRARNPEKRLAENYSAFREEIRRLGALLDDIEKMIQERQNSVIPGREHIEPSTFNAMKDYYRLLLDALEKPGATDEEHRRSSKYLYNLLKLMSQTYDELGIVDLESDKIAMRKRISRLSMIDRRLNDLRTQFIELAKQSQLPIMADDTVPFVIDDALQVALIKESGLDRKPKTKE